MRQQRKLWRVLPFSLFFLYNILPVNQYLARIGIRIYEINCKNIVVLEWLNTEQSNDYNRSAFQHSKNEKI